MGGHWTVSVPRPPFYIHDRQMTNHSNIPEAGMGISISVAWVCQKHLTVVYKVAVEIKGQMQVWKASRVISDHGENNKAYMECENSGNSLYTRTSFDMFSLRGRIN